MRAQTVGVGLQMMPVVWLLVSSGWVSGVAILGTGSSPGPLGTSPLHGELRIVVRMGFPEDTGHLSQYPEEIPYLHLIHT